MAEFDEVLVGGPRWEAPDIQVGLTQLLCSSLAAVVGARAGRSHGMRGWSIGLLGTKGKQRKGSNKDFQDFLFYRPAVQRKTITLLAVIDSNIIIIHIVQSNFTVR